MMIVLYTRRLQHRHLVIVFLSVSMALPWASVRLSREEKPKKIKSVACVETEHLDTTLMRFRASPVKLSFGAMPSKEWYIDFVSHSLQIYVNCAESDD